MVIIEADVPVPEGRSALQLARADAELLERSGVEHEGHQPVCRRECAEELGQAADATGPDVSKVEG
ncbi:MAG: hypothetical protein M3P96_07190 [Actinomycetota bacterium]|nr:hypothetical protein [Actinomycetota bacterium]